MSVPTLVQSNQVPLALSIDGGITYLNVVCKRGFNFNGTTSVNPEETDCGISKGLGAPDWTMDFEGVVNTTPNAGTEISAKQLLDTWQNQVLSYIKTQTGAGTGGNLYIQGSGYVTDYAIQNQVGNLLAFTFTFNGVGAVDTTV